MNITELLASGKFYAGRLCFRGHDHFGKGQSLRRKTTDNCKECELENDRKCKRLNKEKHLKRQKERRHSNIEETRRKEREYNAKNPQAARDKVRKSYYKHKEKRCIEAKEYRLNNPEKWKNIKRKCYYKHHEKNLNYSRDWKRKNLTPKRVREWYKKQSPLQRQINYHRHRAKKYGCTVEKYTVKEAQAIFNNFNNECAYCGCKEKVGIDHYIPLVKGGSESLTNIIPCCYHCNCKKSDIDGWKWFSRQETYTIDRYVAILKSTGVIG